MSAMVVCGSKRSNSHILCGLTLLPAAPHKFVYQADINTGGIGSNMINRLRKDISSISKCPSLKIPW
jgi:hypothetical protein